MTRAAERLHVSQPSLSKQIKGLEEELGKKLFTRTSAGLSLTDEGMLLRKRAEDIVDMVEKTKEEFNSMNALQGGVVRIGCAESYLIRHIARVIRSFKLDYPLLHFDIFSGDTSPVAERLDRGLLDLAVIVEPPDLSKYNYIEIPGCDTWGVVMPRDHPLAQKERVTADDLMGVELICSKQSMQADIPRWCGEKADKLNMVGFVNLCYNGSVFVKEGLCCMLAFNHLANTGKESELTFRPLSPVLETKMYVIWKKHQFFAPIVDLLIKHLAKHIG